MSVKRVKGVYLRHTKAASVGVVVTGGAELAPFFTQSDPRGGKLGTVEASLGQYVTIQKGKYS